MNDRLWPIGLLVAGTIVVAVNFTFIWISHSYAPPDIDQNYVHDANR